VAEERLINIHAVIPRSEVNGPGTRLVVFFQGCPRGCPGCFNPDTHAADPHILATPAEVLADNVTEGVEGLTVSGGEPFEQPEGLAELLRIAKEKYGLTTVVYTGYLYEDIAGDGSRAGCLDYIDVLVDGGFVKALAEPTTLARGSINQRIIPITDRYTEEDFVMDGKVEVIINPDGTVTETGFGRPPRHKTRA